MVAPHGCLASATCAPSSPSPTALPCRSLSFCRAQDLRADAIAHFTVVTILASFCNFPFSSSLFLCALLEFITNAFWQFRLFSFYGRKFSSSFWPFVRALQPDSSEGSMHAINKGPKYLQAHYGNNLINLKQYANGSTKHHDNDADDDEVV